MLCDNLEQWDGVGGRREVPEGRDICTLKADSCCMVETKIHYEAIILQLKIKKRKITLIWRGKRP